MMCTSSLLFWAKVGVNCVMEKSQKGSRNMHTEFIGVLFGWLGWFGIGQMCKETVVY